MKMLFVAACLAAPLFLSQKTPDPGQAAPEGPAIGAAAPSLRLNDQEGLIQTVGGAGELWTVLAFYPKALTGG